jgi:hypothetical protein
MTILATLKVSPMRRMFFLFLGISPSSFAVGYVIALTFTSHMPVADEMQHNRREELK